MIPIVSVVIPVYNVEDYLDECIISVLNQTYEDFEIILVDDGSTDKSGRLCDDYQKRDKRIKTVHRENGGLSAARNTGMDLAQGKYIYFLDSDDYIVSNSLELLVLTAETEQADVVFFDGFVFCSDCDYEGTDENYIRSKKYPTGNGKRILFQLLLNEEYRTPVQFYFFNRKWLIKNSISFLEGVLHEDELFTFLVFNADGTVAHCHEQLYARRIRPESIMTASSGVKRYNSMLKIYYELVSGYQSRKIQGQVANMYLVREAKTVINKYNLMSEEDQYAYEGSYKSFRKSVMKFKGFGDIKLKIKCSDPLMNLFYRGVYKFSKKRRKNDE